LDTAQKTAGQRPSRWPTKGKSKSRSTTVCWRRCPEWQERGGADGENEEKFASATFGVGEVNWWSGKEVRKKHKTREARKHPMLQAFCHKGNEGKPKRHKKAKSY
jgi:hypothetical protein